VVEGGRRLSWGIKLMILGTEYAYDRSYNELSCELEANEFKLVGDNVMGGD
jgi:hypothetical protein